MYSHFLGFTPIIKWVSRSTINYIENVQEMCEYVVTYIKYIHPEFIPEKEAYLGDVAAQAS